MKLLRYGPPGREKPALCDAHGQIRDLSQHVQDIAGDVLLPAGLDRLRALEVQALPLVDPDGLRIGPCVGGVGKVIGIGLNYADHAAESGLAVPPEPVMFLKASSCISGPNDDVLIPRGSSQTDWEVELAVVIGQGGRYIEHEQALNHVAGYCVMNDISERDYQFNRSGTWDKGKGFDTFGPLGPWLVSADEVPDPQALSLWLDLDGVRMQSGNTATMVYPVAFLVSYVSRFMSLQSGDVITTGTPPGVGMGRKPPVFLRAGQCMRLGVQGLGEQYQHTVAA